MVNSSTLYTRRLSQSESGLWLQLEEPHSTIVSSNEVRDCMNAFASLPGALLFLSSLKGNPVGGTAAYRDSARRSLGLVSVKIGSSHKNELLSPMIKSSLPFFRSASIVQADALVSISGDGSRVPFPLIYELPNWVMPTLEGAGFQRSGLLSGYVVEKLPRGSPRRSIQWDSEPCLGGVDTLLKNVGTKSGLYCTQSRLAIDMAFASGYLKTISREGETLALAGFRPSARLGLVTVCLYDPKSVDVAELAASILNLCAHSKVKGLHFLLVGEGQKDLIDSLSDMSRSSLKPEDSQLMRKGL